jgi:peptidoglycan/LPS O-acetylase OafA/YrhL
MLKKFTGPGLLRLALAEIVFVHHLSRFAIGSAAVYVFFCLSGFWVYRMYVGRYSATRWPYFTYIVSRAWRLLPVFWLVSIITLLLLHFNGTLGLYSRASGEIHFILSNLTILGYNSLRAQPIVPAWSLDLEVQFYFLAPFVALLLLSRKIRPVWVLIASSALAIASVLSGNRFPLASFLVFFVLGMTVASLDWRPTAKLAFSCLAVAGLALLCCLLSPWRGILLVGAHPGPLSIYTPHANVVLAVWVVPYAIYTTGQKGFKLDGMFADLSYLIYLLHWDAAIVLASQPGSIMHRLLLATIAWVLVTVLSMAIWKFFDHPINQMRSRWVSRRKRVTLEAKTATGSANSRSYS